jgi:hypothetical protein
VTSALLGVVFSRLSYPLETYHSRFFLHIQLFYIFDTCSYVIGAKNYKRLITYSHGDILTCGGAMSKKKKKKKKKVDKNLEVRHVEARIGSHQSLINIVHGFST